MLSRRKQPLSAEIRVVAPINPASRDEEKPKVGKWQANFFLTFADGRRREVAELLSNVPLEDQKRFSIDLYTVLNHIAGSIRAG